MRRVSRRSEELLRRDTVGKVHCSQTGIIPGNHGTLCAEAPKRQLIMEGATVWQANKKLGDETVNQPATVLTVFLSSCLLVLLSSFLLVLFLLLVCSSRLLVFLSSYILVSEGGRRCQVYRRYVRYPTPPPCLVSERVKNSQRSNTRFPRKARASNKIGAINTQPPSSSPPRTT